MYGMAPMERVISILKNSETDRPAVITPTSVATVESMRATGASFPQAHTDADTMAALAATGYTLLGFDSVAPYFSVQQEAAALGCKVNWGQEDTMPTISTHVAHDVTDFKVPDDFLDRLPVKTVIDSIKLLKAKYGDDVIVIGKVMGPWTLSYHLYGLQDFLIKTVFEPETVRWLLNTFKELSLRFAIAQIEAGADMLTWADHATGDLISADMYKEFLLPVHRECVKKLKAGSPRWVPTILHTCGHTLDRVELFTQTGFDMFHFDSKNDPVEMLEKVDGHIHLTGCINNPNVLLNGNENDVKNQVEEVIDSGIQLVSPECAIPCKVPNKNLIKLTDTVKMHSQRRC